MKNLFKSLANFQQEVPVIHKGTQGYGYSYADLPTIFEIINPLLKSNGLGFSQLIEKQSIKTVIFHIESGETLESTTDIPQNVSLKGMNEFQVLGSAITYIRRYALSSALGLVTDKDTDGTGTQTKTPQPKAQDLKPENELPWLNKMDKEKNFTKQWMNILDGIEKGTVKSMTDVRKFYKISKEIQADLDLIFTLKNKK